MASTDIIRTIIIDVDENARFALKSYLADIKYIEVVGDYDNFAEGYANILKDKPELILIDISNESDIAFEIIEKVTLQHRTGLIFVTANEADPDAILRAMRAGAREFLLKPIESEDINKAMEKTRNLLSSETYENSQGKIITVFSNKGGLGKTTIATNLAINIANLTGKKVALVDLNLQLGDVTTFLDITPSFDISYIVNNLSRIDESFLLSTLEKYKNTNLYVLADPPYLEQAEDITSEQISTILNLMKSTFAYIIIDTNSSFDSKTLCSLDYSDEILLISMVNLPCIRNAQRCLELFNRLDYNKDKIKLIINRYLHNEEITIEDVEDALDHPIQWKIPNNYFTVMQAINRGLPIMNVDSASNINQNLMELSAMLTNMVVVKDKSTDKKDKKVNSLFGGLKLKPLFKNIMKTGK